jgi:hypothetical protein
MTDCGTRGNKRKLSETAFIANADAQVIFCTKILTPGWSFIGVLFMVRSDYMSCT